MDKTIFAITKNPAISSLIETKFENKYKIGVFKDIHSALDNIYSFPPNILIADISHNNDLMVRIINDLKRDFIFGQISILSIIPDDFLISSWKDFLVDDYIRYSDIHEEIDMRVELAIVRDVRLVEVNPLTRLPGNIAITREITRRIQSNDLFSIAYADLDFFKPFNDRYGFSRGDEVIRMLGRLIFNIVRENQPTNSFVGHIGGDDFIYIMHIDLIESTSKQIIEYYDKIIPVFYDYADKQKGYIESLDRDGTKKTFPLMCLSIGIINNRYRKFSHYGEVAEVLAEMKKYAKSVKCSYFIVDRRK
ncbi:MAG: diguanylate cyclase [Bacteroidetes bacterium]|nr:diguanylate cyclase [Bacteroidota bacterium]